MLVRNARNPFREPIIGLRRKIRRREAPQLACSRQQLAFEVFLRVFGFERLWLARALKP